MKNESIGEQEDAHSVNREIAKVMREERKEQSRLINERNEALEKLLAIADILTLELRWATKQK